MTINRVRMNGANQFDICTHFRNLADLDHDELVDFWISLFIIPHGKCGQCRKLSRNATKYATGDAQPISLRLSCFQKRLE